MVLLLLLLLLKILVAKRQYVSTRYTILQLFYLYRSHKKEAADRRKSTVFGDQAKMIRDTFGKGVKTATDTGKVLRMYNFL